MLFRSFNTNRIFYAFYLVICLVQASFTELLDDEAYYWVYSKFLAAGYYDHPPMTAWLIKSGSLIPGELGVRILFVLLNVLTVRTLQSMLNFENRFIFYSIILSLASLQLCFIAVPDSPLLFFTALFFLSYKNFLAKSDARNTFFLAVSIALMFYSKYHGLLIVVFTILSNLSLLKNYRAWMSILIALILYIPHLAWQWQHDWISFRYHLLESNVNEYRISHTTDYLLGQILVAGPIIGFILLPAAFRQKPADLFEKALKFTLIGILIFFFLSSFRGKVEPNWTLPMLVPLVILSHNFISTRILWIRWLRPLFISSFLIIVIARIYIVVEIGPDNNLKERFHDNDAWARTIQQKTGDQPVIFLNSYQRASRYWFYAGVPGIAYNDYRERYNNYDFWKKDLSLLGKPAWWADVYDLEKFSEMIETPKGKVGMSLDSTFSSLSKFKLELIEKKREGKNFSLRFSIEAERTLIEYLRSNPDLKTRLVAGIFENKILVKEIGLNNSIHELIGRRDFSFLLDCSGLKEGRYHLRLGASEAGYPPTHVSDKIFFIL